MGLRRAKVEEPLLYSKWHPCSCLNHCVTVGSSARSPPMRLVTDVVLCASEVFGWMTPLGYYQIEREKGVVYYLNACW
ncbi:hypothetical protein TNCV_3183701 [Trichonephila clavipes]|uniref:Uncharacterized protein n=1 Tax=Trichonephila clavipes TaxID=2585209 RepID=A0A8X6SM22_TRICX|nr:hypothetical protein TNCV_3183701 [Trichonephila clavipes]